MSLLLCVDILHPLTFPAPLPPHTHPHTYTRTHTWCFLLDSITMWLNLIHMYITDIPCTSHVLPMYPGFLLSGGDHNFPPSPHTPPGSLFMLGVSSTTLRTFLPGASTCISVRNLLLLESVFSKYGQESTASPTPFLVLICKHTQCPVCVHVAHTTISSDG